MNRRNRHGTIALRHFFTYAALVVLVGVFVIPLYYLFVIATYTDSEIFTLPPHMFFGPDLAQNWVRLFQNMPTFFMNMFNSLAIAVLCTVTQIFFCTMGAYAFARLQFRGKKILFQIILITFMIPASLNIIPFFQIISAFHWLNSWYPLIVPGMANVFGIFLMTQFIKSSVPYELLDAARIDAMGEFGILIRIVFPLAKSGIAVLGILQFISSWNNFLLPLLVLRVPEITTIPVLLSTVRNRAGTGTGALMLGTAIAVLPLFVIFAFFSRQIIDGLTEGSLKE